MRSNSDNRIEVAVFAFGAGASCLSFVVFALCAAGLATAPALLGVTAVVAVVFARWHIIDLPVPAHTTTRSWLYLFLAIATPFAVLYIVNAAAPEISPDGAGYHLGLVRRYLNHHGFFPITTNFYANFPQACEMLFLAAYAAGRHSAAAIVHCLFLFALPAALIAYGRRFAMTIPGIVAALLFFVTPVAGVDGSSAYVDIALAFAGFLCFYALELWGEDRQPRLLALAGLFAGFAFAIKYTGFVVFLYALGYVLLRRGRLRAIATVSSPAALLALPWLVKNWILVGNPLSPFFNRIFPNPFIDVSFEDAYRTAMRHFGGASLDLTTPFEVALRGGQLQGTIGIAFLLAPIALLALRDRRGRRIWAAALLFALPWILNIGTRFLLPALPFLALAIGMTLARHPKIAAAVVVLNAVLCWPQALSLYCAPYSWRLQRFPIKAALRLTPERDWIAAHAPDVRFAWMIQDHVPPGGVVYTAMPIMEAYTDRTVLLNYTSALNTRIEAKLKRARESSDPDVRAATIREIRDLGVTHLAIHDDEPLGPDISRNPARWLLRPVASAAPLRLYEIR